MQPGNTLFAIARAVNSTVARLRDANCLTNVDQIIAGDVLFVPQAPEHTVPALVSPSGAGTTTASGTLGCSSPSVRITVPGAGQVVSGLFAVRGSADQTNFQFYKLEIRENTAVTYNVLLLSNAPVTDGELARIDSTLFPPGLYWLRLVVVDNTGNVPAAATCVIPVIVE